MQILFLILMIVASMALGFIVLVQNPKGGGLSGNIGGLSNQFMGVKQTNDVLEKGTWIFSILIALLCLFSSFFMTATTTKNDSLLNNINTSQGTTPSMPAQQPTPPVSNQPK